jgi:ABC-2 type transport system ATP-binding protein
MNARGTKGRHASRGEEGNLGPIIETGGLTRTFKKLRAVDDLNLRIEHNELFGLVGPDGAGKTTLLRLLSGLLKISAGSAYVAGHDVAKAPDAVRRRVGYMAQRFSLYAELTVLENLNFFADLYDVTAEEREERTERLLSFAGLAPYTSRRAAHLSGGMRKKLALACTLIHDPPILLLDEPTTGVDPVSRREFWSILTGLYTRGTTIVVSTPYMDEADRCTRVGLMYEGRLIRCAPPDQIRAEIEGELVELVADDWQAARKLAAELPGVLQVQTYGTTLHLFVDSAVDRLPQIEAHLGQEDIAFSTLRRTEPRMEEAFISLVDRRERERGE